MTLVEPVIYFLMHCIKIDILTVARISTEKNLDKNMRKMKKADQSEDETQDLPQFSLDL